MYESEKLEKDQICTQYPTACQQLQIPSRRVWCQSNNNCTLNLTLWQGKDNNEPHRYIYFIY